MIQFNQHNQLLCSQKMTKEIDRIAFEFWSGIGSRSELEDWAVNQLRNDDSHPDACELFNLSNDDAEKNQFD